MWQVCRDVPVVLFQLLAGYPQVRTFYVALASWSTEGPPFLGHASIRGTGDRVLHIQTPVYAARVSDEHRGDMVCGEPRRAGQTYDD